MKSIVIGAHLHRADVEPIAETMRVGDLFASVFAIDDDRPLGDRDLLLQIAAIRSQLLDRATFIAIRYGFSVRDEHELAAKCSGLTDRWRELLIAHRDEVEMTLKAAAPAPSTRPDRRDFATGAEYLRALHESMQAVNLDPQFKAGIEQMLIPFATQHRWLHESASVELAMLVRRRDLDGVRAAGETLRRDFARVPFLLSGPWPLEVFTDDHQQ
jgi:Gas vesicle synthesis protein GvpL/GvpF